MESIAEILKRHGVKNPSLRRELQERENSLVLQARVLADKASDVSCPEIVEAKFLAAGSLRIMSLKGALNAFWSHPILGRKRP